MGLGIFAIGGFSTNYAGSATNPIFQPPAPAGFGFGPVSTRLSMLQFVPTIAGQLTDRLSIGISPTVTVADLLLDPGIFAAPNITGEYPSVTGARPHWGLGLQGGLYYTLDNGFRLGASVKSPVWFETFEFDARDGVGNRRDVQLNLDYPMVVSVGASYAAGDCLVTAIDLRYIDYDNADGLGDTAGFAPTGAVTGLGWDGVFALATGLQYQVAESTSVRQGYLVNESPIPDAAAAFNVGSPNFLQHMITFGMSHQLTPAIKASISYLHLFHNSISGPYTTALTGPIAGSSVDVSTSNNVLAVGLNINY